MKDKIGIFIELFIYKCIEEIIYILKYGEGNILKKYVFYITFCFSLLCILFKFNVLADEPKLDSSSAIVIDNMTGRTLFEKNSNSRASIASLTKVMTSIMLVTNCKIDEKIPIPQSVKYIGGSLAGLKAGGSIRAEDLLYAMLLPSGNDAAYTVGYHIGNGDIKNFASLMTNKAKKLGANDTSFENPHGLDSENHFSTASDVAKITRAALKNEYINRAVSTKSKTIDIGGSNKTLNNTNALLRTYEYADGVKTGFTNDAGRCLIASATKDERRFIAVVLGADTTKIRFGEAKEILDYCFDNYKYVDISDYLKIYVKIPIIKGNKEYYESKEEYSVKVPLKDGEYEKIYVKQEFEKCLVAPVIAGTKIGDIKVYIDDELIYEEDIYLNENIKKKGMIDYINEAFYNMFDEYSKI